MIQAHELSWGKYRIFGLKGQVVCLVALLQDRPSHEAWYTKMDTCTSEKLVYNISLNS